MKPTKNTQMTHESSTDLPDIAKAIERARERGPWMHDLLRRLFPICRSLAGPGSKKTLAILSEFIPLDVVKVPSGTEVFGWTVPNEWHPYSAEITSETGETYARFEDCNLNIVIGSEAIDVEMDKDELLGRIYSLPDTPDIVPYVTSYYHPHWGFCMTDREKQALPPGKYRARIDAKSVSGNLVYGEAVLVGKTDKEILIDTYICHPSMANDNLSSVVVATALYQLISSLKDRHFTYRFIFVPETIGSLCWLHNNEHSIVPRIHAGLVLSCVGDDGSFSFKKSGRGNSVIDRIAKITLGDQGETVNFFPNSGSDERQFCSPGFDLPVGMLSRTYPGNWPYYHTSGDTAERVTAETLAGSLEMAFRILAGVDANGIGFRRTDPRGEPMLSKYDLYHQQNLRRNTSMDAERYRRGLLMWLLNLANGKRSLLDIAEQCGGDILTLKEIADMLTNVGLVEPFDISELTTPN